MVGHLLCYSNWYTALIERIIKGTERPKLEYMDEMKGEGKRLCSEGNCKPANLWVEEEKKQR